MVEEHSNGFDLDYVKEHFQRAKRLDLIGMFFSGWEVLGIERIKTDRQKVYFPNHLSHFDYVALWYAFLSNDVKLPRFAAGINLDFENPIAERMGLNFRKQGAFFIDRDKIKTSSTGEKRQIDTTLERIVQNIFDRGDDLVVFAEGGRSYDGAVMETTEKVKKFTFRQATKPNEGGLRDLEVVPVAVDYDERIEGQILPLLEKVKGRKNAIEKTLYYALDIGSFIKRWFDRKGGNTDGGKCYINFGKPLSIREILSDVEGEKHWSYLRERVASEVRKLYSEIGEIKSNSG